MDRCGIQAGNATCFSTFSTHTKSIPHCFDAIQRCLVAGTIKFNSTAVSHVISTVWYAYINKIVCRLPPWRNTSKMVKNHSSSALIWGTSTSCSPQLTEVSKHLKAAMSPAQMCSPFSLVSQLGLPEYFTMWVSHSTACPPDLFWQLSRHYSCSASTCNVWSFQLSLQHIS